MTYIKPDQTLKNLALKLFSYKGRKFNVIAATNYQLRNYWDGGSKATVFAVLREGLKVSTPSVKTNDPANKQAHACFEIPPGVFLIEHIISCGKDIGITIVVRPDELDTGTLPPAPDVTEHEIIYLVFTTGFKCNYRFEEAVRSTGINAEDWSNAQQSCIAKGLTDKRGTPNITGKNIANSNRRFN
jgi:hypothetical protein